MSWSGPVAGTTPYQPPPYANGQPGFGQQQPFQYGQPAGYGQYQAYPQPQRPPDNRPPKKKGNPIITRYPPPPGYRGPTQPQGPYGANQYQTPYQPPQQGYPQAQPPPTNFPNQSYSTPPSYPPNQAYSPQGYGPPLNYPQQSNYPQYGLPQGSNYQYPQQSYPPNPGYSQTPGYLGSQGYPPQQTPYQGYPSQTAPADPNQQAYAQPQGWQPPNSQAAYSPHDQYNSYGAPTAISQAPRDPNATPTPTLAHVATDQSTSTLGQPDSATSEHGPIEKPQLFLAWDDWDFDFDGAIWPKSNEPIDPNLSLGVIIWRPAKQVTRALPSTYADAEEQALKPPAEKLGNGESVSMYFTVENSHEAFLDVRQTDEWEYIKDDPIFTVFKDDEMTDPSTLVSLEQCIAERDRPDLPLEKVKENNDEEMQDSSWNVMDNLEQALSGHDEDAKLPRPYKQTGASRSQTQEDILAMLGVTGSPKPASSEPVPFPFPSIDEKPLSSLPEKPPVHTALPRMHSRPEQPPQRTHSYGGHRNPNHGPPPQRPYGSMSTSARTQPPPPPEQHPFDPWILDHPPSQPSGHAFDGSRESPARSEGSNRTLAGSDFESEKPANGVGEASPSAPVSQLKQSDSSFTRKRSYEDTDQDEEKLRQQDDHTKRKRRSQVAAAYSRR